MSNIGKAAEVIGKTPLTTGRLIQKQHARLFAHALADAGLLAPDGMTMEWLATVAWRNDAGQVEQQRGRGDTRDAALDDARAKQTWLTFHPTEVAHKCASRHVTAWEAEDTTHTEETK